ncbi:MAG: NrfD/PsrC family molybdoenzyme membrane anchor subunit [Chloroflexota bacterium]
MAGEQITQSDPNAYTPLTDEQISNDLTRPMRQTSLRYFALVTVLALGVAWMGIAWAYMAANGMGVAGIDRPVQWGIFIATFVFWIGLSHSGTLISAILRLSQAEWRRAVTRGAEAMTIFTVMVGALFPLIHLGRVWRFYYIIPIPDGRGLWPNFRSPLVWDFMAITTYLTGSILYFYLPMIPDLALLRDRNTGFRHRVYAILALGWRGSERQWHHLHRGMGMLMVLILPVAVSVHSIVSWDFAMAVVPVWHSTIFAPYFVAGAIYSGLALVITIMYLLRRAFHLEAYVKPMHFDNLGKILFLMSIIWFYFWFSDALTTGYGRLPEELEVLRQTVLGPWLPLWVAMIAFNFVIPFFALMFRQVRRSVWIFVIAVLINIGMFAERYLIVIPPLAHGRMPFVWGDYAPTWVEFSIVGGSFALFMFLYVVFTKVLPVVAIWEVKEGELLKSTRDVAGVKLPTIARTE